MWYTVIGDEIMVTLREFCEKDVAALQTHQYPELSDTEISQMITDWNKRVYDGKYFEMFAVVNDNDVVGSVSLFQQSDDSVYYGVHIFEGFRRQGFAYEGLLLAMEIAKNKHYKFALANIRKSNAASIKLSEKLGFRYTGEHTTPRGILVNRYIKELT